ncbi:MAG: hypothetical protein IPN79_03525 [Saprospiraceae bacterium]|nr:hypothetical protein [Saprospiraceae bacterium]
MICISGQKYFFIAVIIVLFSLTGCLSPPEFDETPEITEISLSKTTMVQGVTQTDSIVFKISFTDGDGDFGSNVSGSSSNIFITDGRNPNLVYDFKAPEIPAQSAENGVRGTIYLTMYTLCCLTGQNQNCCLTPLGCPSENNFPFEVYIKDRSGKTSNKVTTNNIVLICN